MSCFKRIKVKSAQDYFNLSKKEREKWGVYLTPYSLPWSLNDEEDGGWNTWRKQIKKEYPVQYFFREDFCGFLRRLKHHYKELIHYPIKNWIQNPNKELRKEIPRHQWIDRCSLISSFNFALIQDFYKEADKAKEGYVDHSWENNGFYDWLKNSYHFLTKTKPILEEKISKALSVASKKKSGTYEEIYGEFNALEKSLEDAETEILKKMIDYREYFWT